jgi:lipopolysaccharide/colanic/teichoic acid biosynthesis glycosyltransferase
MVDVAREAQQSARIGGLQESAKRALDITLGAVAVILITPLMLFLCWLVRRTSPGPAIFRQERLGRDKQPFTMLKLRTMFIDSDDRIHREYVSSLLSDDPPQAGGNDGLFKVSSDPRVTRIGSFLRRTSLDELPQFLNVVRGDMSLVGPRPVLPWEAEMFDESHQRRFEVRPGITGLWQIRGRSKLSMREALDLDVEYVQRRNLAWDMFILLWTVPALFRGGAS